MKFTFFFIIMVLSFRVNAFECVPYDTSTQPISTHIELASDIFWGEVVSGAYDQVNEVTKFTVDVAGVLKGKVGHTIQLETSKYHGVSVTLGEGLIYFLYNNRKIVNSCAMSMYIGGGVDSIEDLISESKRADLAGAYKIQKLLKQMGKIP